MLYAMYYTLYRGGTLGAARTHSDRTWPGNPPHAHPKLTLLRNDAEVDLSSQCGRLQDTPGNSLAALRGALMSPNRALIGPSR